MSTRRDFLKTTGLGAAGLSLIGSARPRRAAGGRQERPNLLLITTDYQAGEDGPTLGSPFLHMPNLRRLSDEGVVFERHQCTAPICMPSRYTLITGQYPHTHGQWENGGNWLPEGSPVLMERLREAGYHTAGVGKMHFQPWDRMAGFERRIIADRKGNTIRDRDFADDYARYLAEHGLDRWSYLSRQDEAWIYGVYDWPWDERFHIDHFVGERSAELIDGGGLTDPFFLWVSFNGPHNPWDPPAPYADRYKRMDLPPARTRPGELGDKPLDHTRLRYNYTRQVGDLTDRYPERQDEIVHRIRAGHYGNLEFIDLQIGKVLGALEARGLLDDTVVMYSSDHGCHLGDHDLIHKGTHYERSASVPFVVWSPPRFRAGRRRGFTAHVDVLPTLLALAGAPVPGEAEGTDLAPMLTGEADAIRDAGFTEIRWSTAITTDDWKLSVYPRDGEGELYDLREDPDELYNLFEDPGHRSVRRELEARLTAFHPPLAGEIASMTPPVPVAGSAWRLEHGDHLSAGEAPNQRGRDVEVAAEIAPAAAGWADGPIFVTDMDGVHGYALYVRDGRLGLALRRWRDDQVIVAPEPLPAGPVSVGLRLGKDGAMILTVDGKPASGGKAAGGLPVQPGRDRLLAGELYVGHAPAGAPMGGYAAGSLFAGRVRGLTLRLG